ncbi:ABC transporter ATP-binding protein [Frankia sp. AgPm24]|uniref:ABC transporter ATP-binding protein n=1 Tax=Frankia sp. AgPm24 TaxID=631128 RepID=UPI0020364D99
MGPHRARIAAAAGLFIGHQSGEALVPVLIGVIIDRATRTGDGTALLLWLAVLVVDFLALSLCFRFGMRVALFAGVRADRALRLAVTARALDARGLTRTDLLPGALLSIATGDVRRTTMVNFLLPHAVAAAVGTIVASIALLVVSVPLGLLILVGTPLLLLLVRRLSVPLERRADDQQEHAAQAAATAVDLVRGLRVLKGLRAEHAGRTRYRAVSGRSLSATLLATRAEAGQTAAVSTLNGLFLALVALVGGWLGAHGDITVGQLVAAVGLAQFLQGPLGTFGDISASIAAGRASAGRIAGVLDDPPALPPPPSAQDTQPTATVKVERDGGSPAGEPRGELVLAAVDGGGLTGAAFTVAAGELVGVACTDPGAADTLVRYLARQADPSGGRILLDGTPLTCLEPAVLRRTLLVAPHEASLFEGTVRENITAGRTGVDVEPAVRAARADEVAAALPAGLDTAVAERGRSLSGGQRQRVALARALHADPPVLVLHDPTTAVDSVTETQIAAGLRALRAGRTTVVVTTSPALLAAADRVLLLAAGHLDADGHHDSLVRTSDTYRKLVLS